MVEVTGEDLVLMKVESELGTEGCVVHCIVQQDSHEACVTRNFYIN